jgi:hypothetical protein
MLVILQLRQYLLSQLLAEFDSPLVKTEYIPDNALRENFVLVHGYQAAQYSGRQHFKENGIGRPVAFESAERPETLNLFLVFTFFKKIGQHFFLSLAGHQCFCLRKEIGKQYLMMLSDRIMAYGRRKKVSRYKPGALMYKLVKGMLSVSAGLSPDNRTCLVSDSPARTVCGLAVALHIALLEVGRETVHILIVRQYSFSFRFEEISVPYPNKGEYYRDIPFEGLIPEMFVHFISAGQQITEIIETDVTGYGKTDSGPQ